MGFVTINFVLLKQQKAALGQEAMEVPRERECYKILQGVKRGGGR